MITKCPKCGHVNPMATGEPMDTCPACQLIYTRYDAAADMRSRVLRARTSGEWSGIPREHIPPELHGYAAASLPVTTTHLLPGREIAGALDVISAECAYGMNVFKDILTGITDVVGGRSASMQNGLRDARQTVMGQLRAEAFALGADAVVGVSLSYSEISGGGKSMLFVVATGTAVKLATQ